MATTVYDITTDFSDQDIYTDVLLDDAVTAGVPITDVSCRSQSNPNKVLFESATPLSAPDKTTLDGVVAAYDPADGIHGDHPDDQFRIQDNVDPTKELAFEISGVSTGTVRTITVPDADIAVDDSSESRPPDAHAASHSDGGSDEITVEDLATSGTIGQVPTSDGAGGLTMDTPSGSGNVTSPGGETAARITKFTSPNNIDETAVTETQLNTLVGGGVADSEHTHADFDDSTFRVQDNTDPTKEIAFQASTITTGTVRTITVPDADITIDDAGDSRTPTAHAASHSDAGSDEITVEDLATSGGSGSVPTSDGFGALTMSVPAGGGNVISLGGEPAGAIVKFTGSQAIDNIAVTETQLDTLVGGGIADVEHTHADFDDSTFRVQDNTDPTKEIAFQASTITTGTVRTITVPDANITIDDAGDSRTPTAHASSHSDGGSDEITIEDLATAGTNGQVPTSDGAGGLTMETPGGGGSSFPIYKLPAVDLQGSLDSSSDWPLNVLSPLDADPDNDSILVRSHDNAAAEGWGYAIAVPATATNMTIKIRSRPFSGPAGAVTLIPLIYFREEPDAAAIGAWAQGLSASAMDTINFPITDTFYTYFSQTETLATWGVTSGSDWKFQIFNDNAASSLASFWLVRYVEVSFS